MANHGEELICRWDRLKSGFVHHELLLDRVEGSDQRAMQRHLRDRREELVVEGCSYGGCGGG